RGHLLAAFCSAVGDPDTEVANWFIKGCPVGLASPIPYCNVFPLRDAECDRQDRFACSQLPFVDVFSDLSFLSNYRSAEDMPSVTLDLLNKEEELGFCKSFDHFSELVDFVGNSKVVPIKLGLVPKSGTDSFRLICDASENGLNAKISLGERLVLPRISDAVECFLELRERQLAEGGVLEAVSIDFANAF
ncbi:hypothetical protein FOZ63_020021, partial [Perkinsus olseni]